MEKILTIFALSVLLFIAGCTKPAEDPPGFYLSKTKIKEITDRAYALMMAQTDESP